MLLVLRKIIKSQIAVVICDSIAVHNFNHSSRNTAVYGVGAE